MNEGLLFLAHRIPFPPNKGDKIRSFHLLRHLSARYAIHLGAFVDDPEDWQYRDALQHWCASIKLLPLNSRRARLASLTGLLTGEALTLPYYRNRELKRWAGTGRLRGASRGATRRVRRLMRTSRLDAGQRRRWQQNA